MARRMIAMWGLIGAVFIAAGGFGVWLAMLPADVTASPPPVLATETAAMLFASTVLANVLALWNRDEFGIPPQPGIDEVALARIADAWSRTYRSKGVTDAAVVTANGIRVLPGKVTETWPQERLVSVHAGQPAEAALDLNLAAIAKRYGASTAKVVAMQLEYPGEVQAE